MINRSKVGSRSALIKLDIKDFHMDSKHCQCRDASRAQILAFLQNGSLLHFIREDSEFDIKAFDDTLAFLLRCQSVDPRIAGVLYQVTCGSVMGSDHSSFVSSMNFFHSIESGLLCQDSSGVVAPGIQLYTRYHDDMLAVLDSTKNAEDLFTKLTQKSIGCYVGKLESVSLVGVAMLDLFEFKPADIDILGRLSFKPHIKSSARHVPLSSDSHHHKHVHVSWPVSEIRRMYHLSNNHTEACSLFKNLKILRFQQFGMLASILSNAVVSQSNILFVSSPALSSVSLYV